MYSLNTRTVNVLNADTASTLPLTAITACRLAPDPPNPCVIVIVGTVKYPSPDTRTSTEVMAPLTTATLPTCAVTEVAPGGGDSNTMVGLLILLYPLPPSITSMFKTLYIIC